MTVPCLLFSQLEITPAQEVETRFIRVQKGCWVLLPRAKISVTVLQKIPFPFARHILLCTRHLLPLNSLRERGILSRLHSLFWDFRCSWLLLALKCFRSWKGNLTKKSFYVILDKVLNLCHFAHTFLLLLWVVI